jgi:hypothetical protein
VFAMGSSVVETMPDHISTVQASRRDAKHFMITIRGLKPTAKVSQSRCDKENAASVDE